MASTQKTYGALATSAEPQALNTGDTKQRQSRALRAHICIMVVALLAVAAFVMACVAVSKGGGGGRATPGMRGPPGPPGLASHPGDQSGYAVTSVALNESATASAITGADGLPIAFGFDVAGALWAMHCGDYTCAPELSSKHKLAPPSSTTGLPQPISLALGSDRLVYAVYGDTQIMVVHCLTSDCSKASVTNTGHALAQYSATVVISPETGFPVIASLSDGNVGNVIVQTVACLNADCSSSKLSSHGSAPAQLETRVQSAVRPDGRLTLAWIGPYGSTEPYEPVYLGLCQTVDGYPCGALTVGQLANSANSTVPTLLFAADGTLLVARFDSSQPVADTLLVSRCTTPTCGNAAAPVALALGSDSDETIHALLINGLPVFLVHKGKPGVVQAVHCADVSCSSSTMVGSVAPSPGSHVGLCTPGVCGSAFVGANGLPSMLLGGYGGLLMVRCSNPYCVPHARLQ